jgi:hypothetical protein
MEDRDTLLKGAKSFVGRYTHLSAQDQAVALSAKHPRDLARIAENTEELYENLQAFRQLESEGIISLPQSSASKNTPSSIGDNASGAIAGAGLLATEGIKGLTEDKSYEGHKKRVEKSAEEAGKEWEKGEERLKKENEKLKQKGKTPKDLDPNRFTSKEEFMDNHLKTSYDYLAATDSKRAKAWAEKHPEDTHLSRAIDRNAVFDKKLTFEEFEATRSRYIQKAALAGGTSEQIAQLQAKANAEMNNLLLRANPELAKRWATERGDAGLVAAHNQNRQRQIEHAQKNQSRISKLLGRDPAKKFGDEIAPLAAANTIANSSSPNTLSNQAIPNTLQASPQSNHEQYETEESYEPEIAQPMPLPAASKPMPKMPPYPPDTKPAPTPPPHARGRQRKGAPGASPVGAINKAKKAERLIMILTNPVVLAGIIVSFFFLLFLLMLAYLYINACQIASQYPWGQDLLKAFAKIDCDDGTNPDNIPPVPVGVLLVITGPETSDNGASIAYTVDLTYDPARAETDIDQMTLYFKPDFKFDLISATGNYGNRSTEGLITWDLSENQDTPNDFSFSFTITVQPSETNFTAVSYAYIFMPGGDVGDLNYGADSPPTDNNCGQYRGIMNSIETLWPALGPATNYGDPLCTYTLTKFNKLIELTETRHPENIPFWKKVVSCEGGSPNSTALPSSPSESGTWGRFQMRRSFDPPLRLPLKSWDPEKNDRGDVTWQKQVVNAISKNNEDTANNNAFGYWGSAMCLCWWPEHRDKSYCEDIVNKGTGHVFGPRAPAENCPTNTGMTCNTAVRCQNNSCRP